MSILYDAINKNTQGDSDSDEVHSDDTSSSEFQSNQGNPTIAQVEPSPDTLVVKYLLAAILLVLIILVGLLIDIRYFSPSTVVNNSRLDKPDTTDAVAVTHQANRSIGDTVDTRDKQNKENLVKEVKKEYFESYQSVAKPQQVSSNKQDLIELSLSDTQETILGQTERLRERENSELLNQDIEKSIGNNPNINTEIPIKDLDSLTDIQAMMVKEVVIEAHVYSEEQANRFVFVDGNIRQEGDNIINSWYLEQIEQSSVIINNRILRVRIPLE
ncbi:MAG: general secretion pathway protein GspB [Kangiellaceae bacterium]|jgi:hypothetical protein|nr:general secretion pathway protein GspB [Kangiellaceae bacterium]